MRLPKAVSTRKASVNPGRSRPAIIGPGKGSRGPGRGPSPHTIATIRSSAASAVRAAGTGAFERPSGLEKQTAPEASAPSKQETSWRPTATSSITRLSPRLFRREICASEPGWLRHPRTSMFRRHRPQLRAPAPYAHCAPPLARLLRSLAVTLRTFTSPGLRRHVLAVLRILWMPLTGDRPLSRKSHHHLGVRNPGGFPRRLRSGGGLRRSRLQSRSS